MSELERLSIEVDHLRAALNEAADEISEWGAYAGEYFQEKWDLKGRVALYRSLAQAPLDSSSAELIESFHEQSRDNPPHCLVDGEAHPCRAVRLVRHV